MLPRRECLGLTLAAAGCATLRPRPPRLRLPPVRVDERREIRTVVGLRPFRPEGFVVRGERLGDKLLVHNYGHGGGGVTLSWGTADLAAEIVRAAGATRAAVLGCGAVGLATARLLQERGVAVAVWRDGGLRKDGPHRVQSRAQSSSQSDFGPGPFKHAARQSR